MLGRLLATIVIWPIPPAYSAQAVATVVLAAIIVALAQVRSFPGVLAALLSGFVVWSVPSRASTAAEPINCPHRLFAKAL